MLKMGNFWTDKWNVSSSVRNIAKFDMLIGWIVDNVASKVLHAAWEYKSFCDSYWFQMPLCDGLITMTGIPIMGFLLDIEMKQSCLR